MFRHNYGINFYCVIDGCRDDNDDDDYDDDL